MNTQESNHLYPSISSPTATDDQTNPFHQIPTTQSYHHIHQDHHHDHEHESSPSSIPVPPGEQTSTEKWGTHVMGVPAVPTSHPDNKKAAFWQAPAADLDHDQAVHYNHNPYLQHDPMEKSSTNSPMESILHVFNSWTHKAETLANNVWHNLKTNSSVTEAAWGKMNLTAKALTGGGFESLYKQTFTSFPNEKLKKTFASYLSTSTGPVAGTLYLSDAHIAFCSDRPLSFPAPSGQLTWTYYKVMIPLGKIGAVNTVTTEKSSERYIQIVTIDGHDFWFMGFVNYDKASRHLSETVSPFVASESAVEPVVA